MIKALKDTRGSATIEASVMFVLILILIVGFIYLTNAISVYSAVQTAAREGAREYAMTNSKTKAVRKAQTELELGKVDSDSVIINAQAEGQERRMIVTVDYSFYLPFLGNRNIILQGGAIFRRVNVGR